MDPEGTEREKKRGGRKRGREREKERDISHVLL